MNYLNSVLRGKYPHLHQRIFLQYPHIIAKILLASVKICSLKTRGPSSPDFLIVFVAWRSPPSVDFARATSAKTAKKHGFRAGSDYSLLPSRKGVEPISPAAKISASFGATRLEKSALVCAVPHRNSLLPKISITQTEKFFYCFYKIPRGVDKEAGSVLQ